MNGIRFILKANLFLFTFIQYLEFYYVNLKTDLKTDRYLYFQQIAC